MSEVDPLDAVAIHVGHRELLGTLRELAGGFSVPDGGVDVEDVRATLAFLRQGVVPFARREERVLSADPEVRDGVAFEHAFLEVEIDRLATEAAPLLDGRAAGAEERRAAAARVRRTLCRIEAVLELHLLREGDRGVRVPGPSAGPSAAGRAPAPMDGGEVGTFLRSRSWGILCTVGDGRPYGVPVRYAFDGERAFVATGPGRKADNLAGSPAVCLTVPDVVDGSRWRCAVVSGTARPVTGIGGRAAAVRALAAAPGGRPGREDAARLLRARLFAIVPAEITGRRRGV